MEIARNSTNVLAFEDAFGRLHELLESTNGPLTHSHPLPTNTYAHTHTHFFNFSLSVR